MFIQLAVPIVIGLIAIIIGIFYTVIELYPYNVRRTIHVGDIIVPKRAKKAFYMVIDTFHDNSVICRDDKGLTRYFESWEYQKVTLVG